MIKVLASEMEGDERLNFMKMILIHYFECSLMRNLKLENIKLIKFEI
jgi:hypothetical protein